MARKVVPYLLVGVVVFWSAYSLLVYQQPRHAKNHEPDAPVLAQRPPKREEAYKEAAKREQLQKFINGELDAQHAPIASETGSGGAAKVAREPFSTFQCMGDELGETDTVYSAPFRFHVYQNMPKDLLDDVIESAEKYWMPNHSNNQFITEIGLVKDLPLHPCHTMDPDLADAFIVPIQTISMIWLEIEKGRKDGGRTAFAKVMKWLDKQKPYQRLDGRDHYAMAIAWDLGRRPFGRLNLLGPEVPTDFQNMSSYTIDKYLHAQSDIVLPYPDPDAITYYTEETLAKIERDKLAVFVGSMVGPARIRRVIREQMDDFNDRKGQEDALWVNLGHQEGTTEVKDLLPSAIFGPVLRGDSYSSRRLFSLLFAGTIPVIISDRLMLPYENVLDYSSFAIFFSEQQLLDHPKQNIFDILEAIPPSEIQRLQRNGKKVKRHFIFRQGKPEPGDAFDMFVRQLAQHNYGGRAFKNMVKRSSMKTIGLAKAA